jgi:SAM-dependent methyltransferase
MDPVKFRVALPAADPPDNASDIRHSGDGQLDLSSHRAHRSETCSHGHLSCSLAVSSDLKAIVAVLDAIVRTANESEILISCAISIPGYCAIRFKPPISLPRRPLMAVWVVWLAAGIFRLLLIFGGKMPGIANVLCIVCGSSDLTKLVELASVPVVGPQLLRSSEEARAVARDDIRLVGCRYCGHVFNAAFNAALVVYDESYENSLMGSSHYRRYSEDIISRLVSTYGLAGGTAVEIGCGRGEFLRMLCERGLGKGIGFDPGRPTNEDTGGEAAITIISDIFTPSLAPRADIVCSRYVLEHLPHPVDLLRSIREAYASHPARVVFIEVPNGTYMLDEFGIWDPLYEHPSYFTSSSLAHALRLAGLTPGPINVGFGRQFLAAEATFAPSDMDKQSPRSPNTRSFAGFAERFGKALMDWQDWLGHARWNGERLALWGAGAKSVTFLNVLDRSGKRAIERVIDINPLKAGAFIAGTGHPIVPPAVLQQHPPDRVLVMNPEYETEIREVLNELGLDVELTVVSGRLPPWNADLRRPDLLGRLLTV